MTTLLHRDELDRRDADTRSSRRLDLHGVWEPCGTTLVLVIIVAAAGIRGADYPAHHFRALVWDESGATAWNFDWYGGHPTPTYGILSPPVAALIGPFAVVALAALVSTWCFARLTTKLLPGRATVLANHVFAAVVTTNVVVGRVAFGLGLAAAFVAVIAWEHRLTVVAIGTAILTALASPVAGAFLALAGAAVVATRLGEDRRLSRDALVGGAVAVAAMAPVIVISGLFEAAGRFPFRGGHLVASVAVLAAVMRLSSSPTVRSGAALTAAISVLVFVVPNPLGGNVVRLAQIVAIPLVVLMLDRSSWAHRTSSWILVAVAIGWSLTPAVVAAAEWADDPSTTYEYHRALVDEVVARNADGRPLGRIEIPFTVNHWESFYVAAAVPYIRGWERQIDLDRNSVLYDPALEIEAYRRWLRDNGVRWVAVPDVPIDDGGRWEHALIAGDAGPVPWLTLVWSDAHWRLFEVVDYVPIVDPPAELESQDADRIVIRVDRAAFVRLRYAYTDHLAISGAACVTESADGRILVRLPGPGEYALQVGWGEGDSECG